MGLIRIDGHLSYGDTMFRLMADTSNRRPRRQFTDELKADLVRLVLDDGKAVGAVARDMDLTETAVRQWVKRARADRNALSDGADHRRAQRAGAAPQKESRATDGARHHKKAAVGSTGRRNNCGQHSCRRFIAQGLSWTFVEAPRNAIQIGL
jgi:transposase